MNNTPTPETDALECAFTLLKCSPIGNPENSSEYGRAAYILSEHCQGKEDVSEAAMRIFAKRIADLERERDELREEVASLRLEAKYHDEADALRKCRERERDEARYEAAMWALQRDEAREQANVMHEQWLSKGRCCENLSEELHEVKQQRDEARESLENARELNKWLTVFLEHIRDNADIRYGKHRGLLAFSDLREEASRKWKEATK